MLTLLGCAHQTHQNLVWPVDRSLINADELFAHLAFISSDQLEGRKIGTDGNLLTQEYIIQSLTSAGVNPFKGAYQHPFLTASNNGNNLVGYVKGGVNADKYIILTAHFDHLGRSGGKIFNGADDNASGTSAMLSLAKKIAREPLNNSVLFVFTDGEESNLLGAKAFVKENIDMLDNTILNINIDMISGTKRTKSLHYISRNLDLIATRSNVNMTLISAEEKNFRVRRGFNNRETGNRSLSKRNNWKMASDHGAFYEVGVPFIYYGVGTHKNYHSGDDTFANANLELFHKSVSFIYMQLKHIDSQLL